MTNNLTPEQRARDMLERLDHPDAQSLSAGEVVELANLIAENERLQSQVEILQRANRFLSEQIPSGHEPKSDAATCSHPNCILPAFPHPLCPRHGIFSNYGQRTTADAP